MIERADERRVHFRFFLDFMAALVDRGWGPLENASRFENALILAAVSLGELDGRPFGSTKLANYLGISRATAQRRLTELEQAGFILRKRDGRYVSNPERINSPQAGAITDRISALIRQAAADLDSGSNGLPDHRWTRPPK